jgi:hypothetical protein
MKQGRGVKFNHVRRRLPWFYNLLQVDPYKLLVFILSIPWLAGLLMILFYTIFEIS